MPMDPAVAVPRAGLKVVKMLPENVAEDRLMAGKSAEETVLMAVPEEGMVTV